VFEHLGRDMPDTLFAQLGVCYTLALAAGGRRR
jgi:hypothetical protein